MADFRMPSLGADMEFATLVRWRVKPGDVVRRGDIVADVETEKGVIETEIFEAGTIAELIVAPGTKVPVGTVLARVNGAGAAKAPPAPSPAAPAAPPPTRVAPPVVPAPAPAPGVPSVLAPADHVRASPAARHRAEEHHLALAGIAGTGPGGVVTLADVERAVHPAPPPVVAPIAAPIPAPAPAVAATPPDERRAAMRRAIAAAVSRSNREIPHYYLATDIDLSRALAWLRAANERRPVTERILPAALLLKATALALRDVPELNGHWIGDSLQPSDVVNLGIAVSLRGGGLVAPAIHDAAALPLPELMRALADLVARARGGGLRSSELTDATVTVTNLGDLGVRSVFGVIYPPQVALVGFGRVTERPWAIDGMLGVRPVVTATLAADHRASDGHRGGLFLSTVERLLQAPESL